MSNKSSAENYLETILILSRQDKPVRAVDIANELEYTKPSVSVAMKNLKNEFHIQIDGEGYITLTESGKKIAETMYERHVLISDWLIFLGVDKNTAVNDACRIEHDISEQSFNAIKKHVRSILGDREKDENQNE